MKKAIRSLIELAIKFTLIFKKRLEFKKSSFFFVKLIIGNKCKVKVLDSSIEKSHLFLRGENNIIRITNSFISKSFIRIEGSNNKLILNSKVKLRGADIHIRGNNCSIIINDGSSFGGVRMVNVGNNNDIEIGENCLFADHIEIWASDTHSIYDKNMKMINQEKSISIGDRVWIGSHVIILKGVIIGSDSVIGMGTLVTKNIESNVVNVGSPNRTIKKNISWKLDY